MMFSFNETRWKYISLGGGKAFRVKQIHGQWQEKDFFFFSWELTMSVGGEGGERRGAERREFPLSRLNLSVFTSHEE